MSDDNKSSSSPPPNQPGTIIATIHLGPAWGKKSVYVQTGSHLDELKQNTIKQLLEQKIITQDDLDSRNKASHIDIDGDQAIYNKLHGSKINLNVNTFKYRKHTVALELTKDTSAGKLPKSCHFTILYKKNIDEHRDAIQKIIGDVLANLGKSKPVVAEIKIETKPEVKPETKEDPVEVNEPEAKVCAICMEQPFDCALQPCGHICLCMGCGAKIDKCPTCRTNITGRLKVFIG